MWKNFILFIINTFLSETKHFKFKRFLLNLIKNVKIGKNVKIVGPIYFGVLDKFEVDSDTWIGRDFSIEGNGSVKIGKNIDIAPHVVLLTGTHDVGDSTRRGGPGHKLSITIEDGCWICARSTILGNIVIGKSSIIGACSFVYKDVEPNSLIGSSSQKLLKTYEE